MLTRAFSLDDFMVSDFPEPAPLFLLRFTSPMEAATLVEQYVGQDYYSSKNHTGNSATCSACTNGADGKPCVGACPAAGASTASTTLPSIEGSHAGPATDEISSSDKVRQLEGVTTQNAGTSPVFADAFHTFPLLAAAMSEPSDGSRMQTASDSAMKVDADEEGSSGRSSPASKDDSRSEQTPGPTSSSSATTAKPRSPGRSSPSGSPAKRSPLSVGVKHSASVASPLKLDRPFTRSARAASSRKLAAQQDPHLHHRPAGRARVGAAVAEPVAA